MSNSVCIVASREEQRMNAVESHTSFLCETLTSTPSGKLQKNSPTVKVTLPSIRITDPKFVYTNSAQTDISRRFKDV